MTRLRALGCLVLIGIAGGVAVACGWGFAIVFGIWDA